MKGKISIRFAGTLSLLSPFDNNAGDLSAQNNADSLLYNTIMVYAIPRSQKTKSHNISSEIDTAGAAILYAYKNDGPRTAAAIVRLVPARSVGAAAIAEGMAATRCPVVGSRDCISILRRRLMLHARLIYIYTANVFSDKRCNAGRAGNERGEHFF